MAHALNKKRGGTAADEWRRGSHLAVRLSAFISELSASSFSNSSFICTLKHPGLISHDHACNKAHYMASKGGDRTVTVRDRANA